MAVDAKSVPLEDQEEQERQVQRHDAPAHNPSAPPDEFFDISTTVDPSYVISLIRKLLPANASNNHNSHGDVFFAHVQELDTDHTVKTAPTLHVSNDGSESMEIADDFHKSAPEERQNNGSYDGAEQCGHSVPVGEEAWEEYGCILWDLAASKTHAELMVQNLILEVLLANLMVSQSARATEITLGIIGNLACHEVPMKHIVSTSGLIGTVVDQLFSEYAQCLCEACRLLTVGLQSSERISWAKELQSEHILSRILWIAENSLNPQLIEKSVELLLATIESSEEVVLILLPPLMKLGLASLLINLLDFEMSQLLSERVPERYPVLDVILRSIEALSVIDGHSQEICSNKDLFRLVCELVKLPDKVEVANSCITAGVLIANILSDEPNLASEISQGELFIFLFSFVLKLPSDSFGLITPHEVEVTLYIHPDLPFLQGLLDIFPFSSEDLEARSALWNIIARLLVRVQENEMSRSALQQYVSVLVSKSDVIEDDLLDSQLDELNSKARTTSLRRIICLLNQWTASKDDHKENEMMGNRHEDDINIDRLLDCCCKHSEPNKSVLI
ncbi:protein saal1 isoform X2 [Prunus dulcis]|uniref:protein saal1 isoform X2 n=1 Tax=Prunus dulcis TaxID=3755 RepID=UPI001483823A|nr:protein saal1 isoform X2 [Prunus dulcis]